MSHGTDHDGFRGGDENDLFQDKDRVCVANVEMPEAGGKMLSVLIPARNEVYLEKTIRNVLVNARGEIEVLVALDGYLPDPQIHTNDPRVVFYHEPVSIGQRASINKLARVARGEYVMKLDAHCAVDEGFDQKLAADCEPDWTVVPRMYNLDTETWTPKIHKRTDYMFMGMNEKGELRSLYYTGRDWRLWHRRTEEIDDTMGLMGPCFFMRKDRFWELGGCDEGHGGWGQQGVEVACKAWLSGGALKINKKTWFAHWFRAGDGGFPYPLSGRDVARARDYSKDLWLNDKWPGQKRPFKWLLEKFNPPTWENTMQSAKVIDETNVRFYKHIHLRKHHPHWRGVEILKMPSDLIQYHEVIWENRPDIILEIGTKFGGSALFLQDTLDAVGAGGRVVTVDILDQKKNADPRITYLIGDSTAADTRAKIAEITKGKTVMVILDGNHSRWKVKWELHYFAPLVTPGQYLVLEDCYSREGHLYGPGEARDWFLGRTRKFQNMNLERNFLVGMCYGGWLRRV